MQPARVLNTLNPAVAAMTNISTNLVHSEPGKDPLQIMTEYSEKKYSKQVVNKFKTIEDKEIELEMQKIDREVDMLIQKKVREFSFQVQDELQHFPEIDQLTQIIDKSILDYKMAKKFNQIDEARLYKATIKEMKFAKEHLIRVMNMDFSKPTQKMLDMAQHAKIDLDDPKVVEEFKIIQQQTLGDIERLRDGQRPMTEAEMRVERTKMMNQRQEERIREVIKQTEKEDEASVKNTERIVELITKSKENIEARIEFDEQNKQSEKRDQVCLAVLLAFWVLITLYSMLFEVHSNQQDSLLVSETSDL